MKRISNYLWVLFALGYVACSTQADLIDDNSLMDNNIETIKVIAKNFEFTEDYTRTDVNIDNNGATFEWEATDTIGIFPNKGYQVAFPMISGAGTQTATFSGGGWALKASSNYAAYYPFAYNNKDVRNVPISYVGQKQIGNANTQHIGLYDYMSAKATTPTDGGVTFEFQHIGALLQLNLDVPNDTNITSLTLHSSKPSFICNGEIDLMGDNLNIEASEKSKNLSIELFEISKSEHSNGITVYMMIPPINLINDDFKISITNDIGKVAEYKLTGKNFEAGKAYSLSAKFDIFEEPAIQIVDNRSIAVQSSGGILNIEYLTNIDCEIIIPEDASNWIEQTHTRTLMSNEFCLNIKENTSVGNRSTIVLVKSKTSDIAMEYGIIQAGINSYAITETNQYMPIGVLTGQYPATSQNNCLANLVDNKLDSYYEVGNDSFWVEWEGPFEIGAKSFGFGFVTDGSDPIDERRPTGVTISLSRDGKSWNGIGWSAMTAGYYFEGNGDNRRAKRIRLEVLGNNGGNVTHVAEFHIFENPNIDADIINIEDLVNRGSSFTKHNDTSMGNHYANKHVTTDNDRAWLANAANEPALLQSSPGYTLRPYKVTLYPSGTPIPADANQHGVGDCSAVAVLAEMAYLFPDFIKSIITDHGDGTFTVAMYDPQGQPINVAIQSTFLGDDNGLGAASGKNGEATWATVMEKAIMKWNYIYQVNPDINGIGSEHVAPLFTGEGNSFAITPSSLSAKQLKQAVTVALANRMIVIGGFTKSDIDVGYGPKTISAHAYSFMLSDDIEAMFAMRNPWGYAPGGNKEDDGILKIYNDEIVPPLIDLRIIYPGAATKHAVKDLQPYIPPQY